MFEDFGRKTDADWLLGSARFEMLVLVFWPFWASEECQPRDTSPLSILPTLATKFQFQLSCIPAALCFRRAPLYGQKNHS